MRVLRRVRTIYWYVLGWFGVNLLFLTKFPFMHSDESWLSGLTRSMMGAGLDSTETFFDLAPRYPHAIKTIYHLIQMLFIKIFGYNLFSVRLISLIAAAASLIVLYKIGCFLFKNKRTAFWAAVLLSMSIQFIYAGHFARQEMLIVLGMLTVVYLMIKQKQSWTLKTDMSLALATGICIGIHPNSFIIALCAGSIYLYFIIFEKQKIWKNLFRYILFTGAAAGIFIGISYIFDGQFLTHYLKYGSGLGVVNPLALKTEGILYYYEKLFRQISVTYYTPDIRIELIFFAVATIGTIIASVKQKSLLKILLPLLAINTGLIIIGRYSQPGIILIFPFAVLALFSLINQIKDRLQKIVSIIVCLVIMANSVIGITPYLNSNYEEYLSNISGNVPDDAVVLANLNSEYAYGPGQMYDYRNLAFMNEAGTAFEDYINDRDIEYIIYPEEMDFIYRRRPVWNVVYGNLYPYYDDMQTFFENNCIPVYEFTSPYAMRIVHFAKDSEWKVKIYKVVKDD